MRQYLEYLGYQLRRLRSYSGMTQAELGAKLGVNQSYIATLERAKDGKQPTIEFLLTVCDFFNVGLDDLLGTHYDGELPKSDLDKLPDSIRVPIEQLIRNAVKEIDIRDWRTASNTTMALSGPVGVAGASRKLDTVVTPDDDGVILEQI